MKPDPKQMEKYRQASLEVLIDFDGTLAEFDYPALGAPRPGALEFCRWLIDLGLRPVVWSSRMSRAHNSEDKARAEMDRLARWLSEHDFPSEVDLDPGLVGKRLALSYLDDRGVACDESVPWEDVKERIEFIHAREAARWAEYDKTLNKETDTMRQFDTGATRDTDEGKLDFEGFLSPAVLERFAEYMNENRIQADGNLRDSDNWQKGIPQEAYVKSGWRHFFAWWKAWRRGDPAGGVQDACALLFNVMGFIHEQLKGEEKTSLEKIRDGLHLAEKPIKIPGAKSTFVSWEDVQTRVTEAVDKRAARHCGDDYSLEDRCNHDARPEDVQVVESEWYVTCACGWDGQIDQLIMDGTNRACLCPDCCAPLMELKIEITPTEDEDNLYEQIGKSVTLGLAYGAGLPKLVEIIERIYNKEKNK